MILFNLKCSQGHVFDVWFKDGKGCEVQMRNGDVVCPHCGDVDVAKAPMTPHLAKGRAAADSDEHKARQLAEQILDAVGKLRGHVEANCDYVGDRFPEEARRIHYGETEERGIYGEADSEEVQEMREEGIEFFRLPNGRRRRSS